MKFDTNLKGVKWDLEIVKHGSEIERCEINGENSKGYEKVIQKVEGSEKITNFWKNASSGYLLE